jgi:hypothetical protein
MLGYSDCLEPCRGYISTDEHNQMAAQNGRAGLEGVAYSPYNRSHHTSMSSNLTDCPCDVMRRTIHTRNGNDQAMSLGPNFSRSFVRVNCNLR